MDFKDAHPLNAASLISVTTAPFTVSGITMFSGSPSYPDTAAYDPDIRYLMPFSVYS